MLLVNTNSKILNPAPSTPAWIREQRQLGRDYFTARHPIIICANNEQRKGWCEALNAQAYAETSQYLVGMAVRS